MSPRAPAKNKASRGPVVMAARAAKRAAEPTSGNERLCTAPHGRRDLESACLRVENKGSPAGGEAVGTPCARALRCETKGAQAARGGEERSQRRAASTRGSTRRHGQRAGEQKNSRAAGQGWVKRSLQTHATSAVAASPLVGRSLGVGQARLLAGRVIFVVDRVILQYSSHRVSRGYMSDQWSEAGSPWA